MPENEMETLLRGVAGNLYIALRDLPKENNIVLCFERVLLRESDLLRLLEAGQAMRERLALEENNSDLRLVQIYDAAKAAVKEKAR